MIAFATTDPEPIADNLLNDFGTLERTLSETHARLTKCIPDEPDVVSLIVIARAATLYALRMQFAGKPLLSNSQSLHQYLISSMSHDTREHVRLLHLNVQNLLLHDEIISQGTIDEAPIYIRDIIGRSIEVGSSGIILVHNHPSGDPSPSRNDIEITKQLARATSACRISLHDHLIVGGQEIFSFRQHGLI